MLVVGLTGGIATGKSTVSNLLHAKGVPIIDADLLAREFVAPGGVGLRKIAAMFGEGVILPDGNLDRAKLASIIFSDEKQRKKLNSVSHPFVRRGLLKGVLKCWLKGEKLCVMDVPLLIEGPLWKLVSKVVVVYCPEEVQLQRLMKRDSSSEEAASSRLSSQLPVSQKRKYADIVIDNSGTPAELEALVDQVLRNLRKDAGWFWWRIAWFIPPIGALMALRVIAWKALKRTLSSPSIKKDV